MDSSTHNLLYERPELYELIYPEQDEASPRMCLKAFDQFMDSRPRSILDVGCGTARDLNVLSRHCGDCWGVDYQAKVIEYAKNIRPHLNLTSGDMRTFHLGRKFDAVVCFGSTLMYALDNADIDATLQTFAIHSRQGTLLLLDLNNASAFLPGGPCGTQWQIQIDKEDFSAKASISISFDRLRQHMIRKRVWSIAGENSTIEDHCRYRMLFPAELQSLLLHKSFETLGIWDNQDFEKSDLTGSTLYVVARYSG